MDAMALPAPCRTRPVSPMMFLYYTVDRRGSPNRLRQINNAFFHSGVVQLAAHQTLDLVILVRVQAPEPILSA
jgi:hypothetical protein